MSKYTRRRSKLSFVFKAAQEQTSHPLNSISVAPFYDPFRHYDEILPAGVPSHCSLPSLSLWYSEMASYSSVTPSKVEDLDDNRSSDKEVISTTTHPPVGRDVTILKTALETTLKVPEFEEPEEPTFIPPAEADSTDSMPRGIKRSHSKLSSIRRPSVRSVSIRISSVLSRSVSHVTSVLSASDSWRSSLVYAKSIASDTPSIEIHNPLARDEAICWNELVDESNITTTFTNPRDYEAASLRNRPCCAFFENDTCERTLCDICGFSEVHQLARSSLSDDGGFIDSSVMDRFGNTPLHHAAAAGNIIRVLQLMQFEDQSCPIRNTSGETYLHVLWLEGPERFLELVKKASSLGFSFFARDHSGVTVYHNLRKLRRQLVDHPDDLKEIDRIMMSTRSSTPQDAGRTGVSHILASSKRRLRKLPKSNLDMVSENLEASDDSELISTLRHWREKPQSLIALENLILKSDIHARDSRGYTALAIAVRNGNRAAAILLLRYGANPTTLSYQKTSVYAHALAHLARAQKKGDVVLYAGILSCIVLLTDNDANSLSSVYEKSKTLFAKRYEPENNLEVHLDGDEFRRLSSALPLNRSSYDEAAISGTTVAHETESSLFADPGNTDSGFQFPKADQKMMNRTGAPARMHPTPLEQSLETHTPSLSTIWRSEAPHIGELNSIDIPDFLSSAPDKALRRSHRTEESPFGGGSYHFERQGQTSMGRGISNEPDISDTSKRTFGGISSNAGENETISVPVLDHESVVSGLVSGDNATRKVAGEGFRA